VDPTEGHCVPKSLVPTKTDEKNLSYDKANPDDHAFITGKKKTPACSVTLDKERRQGYKNILEY
jgi:hypothetical protein